MAPFSQGLEPPRFPGRFTALNEVRFELSLPTGFDKKKITAWGLRLILGNLPNQPADFTIQEDEPVAPATVDVKIKTGTL